MHCTWFEDRLGAYLEGALRAREARAVAAHLRSCPTCPALYEELRVVDGLLHTSRPIPAPTVIAAVMAGVRAQPAVRRTRIPLWLAAALYLVVAWLGIAALWALGGASAFAVPLGDVQSAAGSAFKAYSATLQTFGPLVPALAAFVTLVLIVDVSLVAGLVYFYRHLRPRMAAHIARTESA